MAATFSDLELVDQGAITPALDQAPAPLRENILAAILGALPDSPTHKQIVDASVMALVQVGLFLPVMMGLQIITGPDIAPVIAGDGAMQAAATAV
jgi:hypothetical protein